MPTELTYEDERLRRRVLRMYVLGGTDEEVAKAEGVEGAATLAREYRDLEERLEGHVVALDRLIDEMWELGDSKNSRGVRYESLREMILLHVGKKLGVEVQVEPSRGARFVDG